MTHGELDCEKASAGAGSRDTFTIIRKAATQVIEYKPGSKWELTTWHI